MPFRPASETIEILRRTLVRIEDDHPSDLGPVAQLKRILLQRIAVLELDLALVAQPAPVIPIPSPEPAQPSTADEAVTSAENAA